MFHHVDRGSATFDDFDFNPEFHQTLFQILSLLNFILDEFIGCHGGLLALQRGLGR